jgi:hypothetical protein
VTQADPSTFNPANSALPLAAHRALNVGGRCLDQVGAFVPDASEGVIATLANGPGDHADRAASTFDVEGPTMQTGAGHEQVGAKGRIAFPANPDHETRRPEPNRQPETGRGGGLISP